jgi:hypothetical protein
MQSESEGSITGLHVQNKSSFSAAAIMDILSYIIVIMGRLHLVQICIDAAFAQTTQIFFETFIRNSLVF